MAIKKINDDNLKAIADKLREVLESDSSVKYTVDEMSTAIKNLIEGPGTCNFSWNSNANPTQVKLNITSDWTSNYNIKCTYRFESGAMVTINWGDGSDTSTYTGTTWELHDFTHSYSKGGNYTISITMTGTCEMYRAFGLVKK